MSVVSPSVDESTLIQKQATDAAVAPYIPTEDEMKKKRWAVLNELVQLILVVVSLAMAVIAFRKIENAASDVRNIVENWQKKPISDVTVVSSSLNCPTGYETVNLFKFQGVSSETKTGCGCLPNAKYQKSGSSTLYDAKSRIGEPCFTNQTSNAQYTCRTIPGLSAFDTSVWRNNKFCYKRGFLSAVDTPYPDDQGNCPSGFHKCGSGNFDSDRAFCASDNTAGCPVTWLGSTNTLSLFGVSAGTLSNGIAAADSSGQNYYVQKGNDQGVGLPGWSALPLVDIDSYFQLSGTQGPCYGNDQPQDEFPGVEILNAGGFKVAMPQECPTADARWMPSNQWDLPTWWTSNLPLHTACSSMPASGTTGSQPNIFAPNPSISGTSHCLNSGSSPASSVCASNQPYVSGCTDDLCKMAYEQTACGAYLSVKMEPAKIGMYMTSQIYWSTTCSFEYTDVMKVDGPLAKAISWQRALLVVNCIMNIIMIIMSIIILHKAFVNWNTHDEAYAHFQNVVKPRIDFVGNWVKVPIVIVTIVLTNAIAKFFTRLASENCSDAITNASFAQLGKDLPSVVTSNITVLVMDLVDLIIPYLQVIYLKHCTSNTQAVRPSDGPQQSTIEMQSPNGAVTVQEKGMHGYAPAPQNQSV